MFKSEKKLLSMEEIETVYGLDMENQRVAEVFLEKGYFPSSFQEDGSMEVTVVPPMIMTLARNKYGNNHALLVEDFGKALEQYRAQSGSK